MGELRAELDDQVQLVQQLKDQLDSYRELQQRSQRLWDQTGSVNVGGLMHLLVVLIPGETGDGLHA